MVGTIAKRTTGIAALVGGLLLGLVAPEANAQVAPPRAAGIQSQFPGEANPGPPVTPADKPAAGEDFRTAATCGFWNTWDWTAYYTHCGHASSIRIQVRMNWGTQPDRTLWVLYGTTNLSDSALLQGGTPTNAWCISNCY